MEDFQEYILSLNPPISESNLEIMKKVDLNPRTLRLPKEEVVKELTEAGMSRLTALDIVTTAQAYLQKQEDCLKHPLGIFWDVENIRIPKNISGETCSDLLKRAVRPLGNPVVCNAYFESSDQGTIVPYKRQKLQQCGWNLMDVPHMSKKEVADKVIIVDILLFVLDHSIRRDDQHHHHHYRGAGGSGDASLVGDSSYNGDMNKAVRQPVTVVLVTDDSDFSYLLAKLKAYPNVKTVIISKHESLLSLNADVSMRWSVDILKTPVVPDEQGEHNANGRSRPIDDGEEDEVDNPYVRFGFASNKAAKRTRYVPNTNIGQNIGQNNAERDLERWAREPVPDVPRYGQRGAAQYQAMVLDRETTTTAAPSLLTPPPIEQAPATATNATTTNDSLLQEEKEDKTVSPLTPWTPAIAQMSLQSVEPGVLPQAEPVVVSASPVANVQFHGQTLHSATALPGAPLIPVQNNAARSEVENWVANRAIWRQQLQQQQIYQQNQVQTQDESDDDDAMSVTQGEADAYNRRQLIKVMRQLDTAQPTRHGRFLKSLVGIKLRESNPEAFGDKGFRAAIFDKALAEGVITQSGTLGDVTVQLTPRYRYGNNNRW